MFNNKLRQASIIFWYIILLYFLTKPFVYLSFYCPRYLAPQFWADCEETSQNNFHFKFADDKLIKQIICNVGRVCLFSFKINWLISNLYPSSNTRTLVCLNSDPMMAFWSAWLIIWSGLGVGYRIFLCLNIGTSYKLDKDGLLHMFIYYHFTLLGTFPLIIPSWQWDTLFFMHAIH